MRINNNPELNSAALGGTRDANSVQNTASSKIADGFRGRASGDQTQLSGLAQQIGLEGQSRESRISELQTAVDNGTYNVPSHVLAGSIIREWLSA